jgi:L-rhamnose mutarotase
MRRSEGAMERVCFLLQVRPERLEEYKARHVHVWQEMREALSSTGWRNYSLFLRNDGLLVGYLETPSFEKALAGMAALEVNQRWQEEMKPFFIGLRGHADESMVRLEEVFHLT